MELTFNALNMITTCYILGSCIAVVLGLYNRKV